MRAITEGHGQWQVVHSSDEEDHPQRDDEHLEGFHRESNCRLAGSTGRVLLAILWWECRSHYRQTVVALRLERQEDHLASKDSELSDRGFEGRGDRSGVVQEASVCRHKRVCRSVVGKPLTVSPEASLRSKLGASWGKDYKV